MPCERSHKNPAIDPPAYYRGSIAQLWIWTNFAENFRPRKPVTGTKKNGHTEHGKELKSVCHLDCVGCSKNPQKTADGVQTEGPLFEIFCAFFRGPRSPFLRSPQAKNPHPPSPLNPPRDMPRTPDPTESANRPTASRFWFVDSMGSGVGKLNRAPECGSAAPELKI